MNHLRSYLVLRFDNPPEPRAKPRNKVTIRFYCCQPQKLSKRFDFFLDDGVCTLFLMRFLQWLPLLLTITIVLGTPQDVSYIRYYKTENDLLRSVEIKPAEARKFSHIEALYNGEDQLRTKITVGEDNIISEQEIYEYNEDGSLWRRAVSDGEGNVTKMYIHGEEDMSATFISIVLPHRNLADFDERTTVYNYDTNGKVSLYQFLSVDHTPFGQIKYDYFEEGLVKEERWTDMLAGQTVRAFKYRFNPISREYTMVEYDARGEEVSRVGITLPRKSITSGWSPLDAPTDIPGNRLEESSEIIENILIRKAEGWNPAQSMGKLMDPKVLTSPDLITMKNGDSLKVELIQINNEYVRFMLTGDRDMLTLPLARVTEIERRDGEILYPVIYR